MAPRRLIGSTPRVTTWSVYELLLLSFHHIGRHMQPNGPEARLQMEFTAQAAGGRVVSELTSH